MMRRNVLIGVAVVALASVLAFVLTRPSEEQRIEETLRRLVKMVSVKDGDTLFSRAGRIRSGAKEIVDDGIRVEVPDLDVRVTGREPFADGATKAGLVYQSASAELVQIDVKLDEARTTAKADATVIVSGVRYGDRRVDKRRVHFLLRKDGEWKITTIDVAGEGPE
jgi:hypothetical protein